MPQLVLQLVTGGAESHQRHSLGAELPCSALTLHCRLRRTWRERERDCFLLSLQTSRGHQIHCPSWSQPWQGCVCLWLQYHPGSLHPSHLNSALTCGCSQCTRRGGATSSDLPSPSHWGCCLPGNFSQPCDPAAAPSCGNSFYICDFA